MLPARFRSHRLFLLLAVPVVIIIVTEQSTRGAISGTVSKKAASWFDRPSPLPPPERLSCSPAAWSNGSWIYSPPGPERVPNATTHQEEMKKKEDVHYFTGFQHGCASAHNYWWHLGADKPQRWNKFPGVTSWKWQPGEACSGYEELGAAAMIRELVEGGGWLLIGDSVTENHFFSLTCVLAPYVVVTPNFAKTRFTHQSPHHILLNSSSSLFSPDNPNPVRFPPGFNISSTPLVTFRRADLLFSKEEITQLHTTLVKDDPQSTPLATTQKSLFSDEALYTLPLQEYLDQFLSPLPSGGYRTLIVSTAGHWNTHLFSGAYKPGIDFVLQLFQVAMEKWVHEVEKTLAEADRAGEHQRRARIAVIRPYTPGHERCEIFSYPWQVIQPWTQPVWNWISIERFNEIVASVMFRNAPKFVHYLPIDRPARLRPDAHVASDCLHLMAGTGVLEGWTQYIWHFVLKESGITSSKDLLEQ